MRALSGKRWKTSARRRAETDKGWQLIKVSLEDAERKLACNGLVLDENTILIAAELPELANELAKAGQTVVTTPFSAVYWQGGAFRCWHHPLVRESTLS